MKTPDPLNVDDGNGKKQCPHCEEWFTSKGYPSHARYCDERDEESASKSEPEIETSTNEVERDVQVLDLIPKCTECESELKSAKKTAKNWRRNGFDEEATNLQKFDYFCEDCHLAYTKDEVN